jgi:hypothetical protein
MATVRLSDVFVPTVYGSYTAVDNPETSPFLQSGIVVRTPVLDAIARAGGKNVTVPFWKDIDPTQEPNYGNDDPADLASPDKVGTDTMSARKAWVNKGFSEMDLVSELSGESPMQHIRNRFGTYWTRQWERRLIASCVGVMADNIANDGSDMTIDVSGNVGEAAYFGANVFVAAAYSAGDRAESFKGIAIHSRVMASLVLANLIVYLPDAQGALTVPSYMGRRIIVDDMLPFSGTGADMVFTSIMFGSGAIGFGGVEGSEFAMGEGVPKVPVEVWRQPQAGNGAGMEELWERKTWMLHPYGYEFVEGTLTEMSPTLADLRLAAHWNRKVSRKQVPLAFIKSKVAPLV